MKKIVILWIVAASLSGCTISSGASQAGDANASLDPITKAACDACPKSCLEDNRGWVDWCRGWFMDSRGGY